MELREKLAEYKRQRDEVWKSLDAAQIDLRTLQSLPKSPQRDEEVRRKQKQVDGLEDQLGRLHQIIGAVTPPGGAGV